MALWRVPTNGRPPRRAWIKMLSEKKGPVRGDNRTGQAILALGVDGRSRRIQPMGRDFRSHLYWSPRARRAFKTAGEIFYFFERNFWARNLFLGPALYVCPKRLFHANGSTPPGRVA